MKCFSHTKNLFINVNSSIYSRNCSMCTIIYLIFFSFGSHESPAQEHVRNKWANEKEKPACSSHDTECHLNAMNSTFYNPQWEISLSTSQNQLFCLLRWTVLLHSDNTLCKVPNLPISFSMALELYRKDAAKERINIFFFSLKTILIANVKRAKLWSLVQFICAKAAF